MLAARLIAVSVIAIFGAWVAGPDAQQAAIAFEGVSVIPMDSERVVRNVAMSWTPQRWSAADTGKDQANKGGYTPWMRMFQNARVWVG